MKSGRLGEIIKGLCIVENNLDCQSVVNFIEDLSMVNTGYAAESLAICRSLALNMLGSGEDLLETPKELVGIAIKFYLLIVNYTFFKIIA